MNGPNWGSPPRARGHPRGRPAAWNRRGLTPACAGTSGPAGRVVLAVGAHPRVRGDIDRCGSRLHRAAGSPPRARGHLSDRVAAELLVEGSPPRARGHPGTRRAGRSGPGLTPACAGTSRVSRCPPQPRGAHPRVRGDIITDLQSSGRRRGSPPRARGHRALPASPGDRMGLTPACAGTSPARAVRTPGHGAHPRVRGDIGVPTRADRRDGGSPPRARGHRQLNDPGPTGRGLTPACAGTSRRQACGAAPRGAHPRVRGDISADLARTWISMGSPPRARGHLRPVGRADQLEGLTPACAGTSPVATAYRIVRRAHPRVRGDIDFRWLWDVEAEGSPPRARGHLGAWRGVGRVGGLTPACAGTSGLPALRLAWGRAHPRVRGDISASTHLSTSPALAHPRVRGDIC